MAAFGRTEGLPQVERSREILISSFNSWLSAGCSLTFRNSAGTRYCGDGVASLTLFREFM